MEFAGRLIESQTKEAEAFSARLKVVDKRINKLTVEEQNAIKAAKLKNR